MRRAKDSLMAFIDRKNFWEAPQQLHDSREQRKVSLPISTLRPRCPMRTLRRCSSGLWRKIVRLIRSIKDDIVQSKSHHHNDNRQRDRTRRPHWFLWWRTARTAGTPLTSNSYHCYNLSPGFANPEFGIMFSNCTHLSWGQEFFATEPSSNNQHLKGNKQTLFQLLLRRRCLTMENSRTKN